MTGSRGYLGKDASTVDRLQSKKLDPRSDFITLAHSHLEYRPARSRSVVRLRSSAMVNKIPQSPFQQRMSDLCGTDDSTRQEPESRGWSERPNWLSLETRATHIRLGQSDGGGR